MGLLDRIRSGRQADGDTASPDRAATAAGPGDSPPPVESRRVESPVITPHDLWPDVPDWQKVPPIEPVIEEPPWIVSQHFDDSLVARQAPPRFIGELGHSVSETAPSGVVEGVAVLAPELNQGPTEEGRASESAVGSDELPLATLHASATQKSEPDVIQERRLWPEEQGPRAIRPDEEPESAEPVLAAEYSADPAAPADAVPSELALAEPVGRVPDLVGASPAAPAVQRLAVAEPEPSPFVRAETPPDLPLAQLPSALLLPSSSEPTRVPTASQPDEAPAPTAALVGQLPTAPPPASPPVVARELEVAAPEAPEEPSELPLAQPPSKAVADLYDDALDLPAQRVSEFEPSAPDLSYEAADEASSTPPSEPPDLAAPLAGEVAPLVGQATPIAAEPEPLAPVEDDEVDRPTPADGPLPVTQRAVEPSRPPSHPPPGDAAPPSPRRRPGLGAPLADLPTTSVGWDITKLSRSDQLKWSRDMARAQRIAIVSDIPAAATPEMPLAGERASRTSQPPTPDEPVVAGSPLPVVPLEEYAPSAFETGVADLPSGESEAPILARAASLRPADSPGGRPAETTAPVAQRAPATGSEGASTRAVVGRMHGVDLTNVPVHRSEEASAAATEMHARAFTSPGGIAIPLSAGPIDSGEGQALLAHELTHVAQRARLGGQVPDERSPAGQRLEAEARATELVYASPVAVQPKATDPVGAADGEGAPLPLAPTTSGPDQEALAASILQRLSDLSGMPAGSEFPVVMTSPLVSGGDMSQIQRADQAATSPAPTSTSTPSTTAPGDKKTEKDAGPFGKRPSDKELANLSYWLYPLISHKIKGELREGRERLGMITDHYRKW